jgi:hypothetical protein
MEPGASIDNIQTWPFLLEEMARSPHEYERQRRAFINGKFEYITEGLRLEHRGQFPISSLWIVGAQQRTLDQCGDGLRDILGVVMHLAIFPQHDLFLRAWPPSSRPRPTSLVECPG